MLKINFISSYSLPFGWNKEPLCSPGGGCEVWRVEGVRWECIEGAASAPPHPHGTSTFHHLPWQVPPTTDRHSWTN